MNNIANIRRKLEKGELCFGTHCSTADADFYEMCGLLDYDYIWIDNEHAGMTQPMIKNAIVATNAGGCSAFVRVADHNVASVKPVIECGPDGVIFPMVNTADEARQLVSICTYPPKGTRGFGPLRAIDYGTMDFEEYVKNVDGSFLKIMQCEHVQAVNNLDEILEVPGVDVIICGPMDLSASVNKIGRFFDPEVLGLMKAIIAKCKAHKKPFGLSIGMDIDLVKFWIEQGANFLSMGTPQDYFREMSKQVVKQARQAEAQR
ncbi:MAG: aldolase/citrate lyase family protein [Clostridia bacterium]|nr:aldolase/citrate lyase family protein [Clostridia bacterium]